ncbi:MAG: adenosylcobinamide-phosphate synthase CbiB [Pseudomonadota bacterium]
MLALAMILDAVLGEPDWAWRRVPHPVVLIGRAIRWAEGLLNRGPSRRMAGAAMVAGLVLAMGAIGWVLSYPIVEIVLVAILLAQRSLVDHVRAVAHALEVSQQAGRDAVAQIVGRETAEMEESDIARAAIESAAENFSDGVVAPVFWFAVAGLPGILIYKAVNTADSMVGYRTKRYREFGWAPARLDDVLNWIPARLSGLLLACVSLAGGRPFEVMARDAGLHRSPNAGWPEAAMAGALNIALSGPRVYDGRRTDDPYVNADGRKDVRVMDIHAACGLLWRAWAVLLLCAWGMGRL